MVNIYTAGQQNDVIVFSLFQISKSAQINIAHTVAQVEESS